MVIRIFVFYSWGLKVRSQPMTNQSHWKTYKVAVVHCLELKIRGSLSHQMKHEGLQFCFAQRPWLLSVDLHSSSSTVLHISTYIYFRRPRLLANRPNRSEDTLVMVISYLPHIHEINIHYSYDYFSINNSRIF